MARGEPYTPAEDEILRQYKYVRDIQTALRAAGFPPRTTEAIRARKKELARRRDVPALVQERDGVSAEIERTERLLTSLNDRLAAIRLDLVREAIGDGEVPPEVLEELRRRVNGV